VLPYGDDGHGHAVLLTASPLRDDALAALQAQLALPAVQRIVREGEIADGLRLLRGVPAVEQREPGAQPAKPHPVPLLGDLLIERGAVSRKDFDAALQRYRPADHGRIGDYMVEVGVISPDALNDAIAEQQRRMQTMTAAQ
jgi:adsorption protein B